jgi:hypothetical protein
MLHLPSHPHQLALQIGYEWRWCGLYAVGGTFETKVQLTHDNGIRRLIIASSEKQKIAMSLAIFFSGREERG